MPKKKIAAVKIGIMGAMPEETEGIVSMIKNKKKYTLGMRDYYTGAINGVPVVAAFSRWGKVAAAVTAAMMIQRFKVGKIIFTGVAGGIKDGLKIGDIILGARFIQHDLDGRPLMKRCEIPLLGKTFIDADTDILKKTKRAAEKFAREDHHTLSKFNIKTSKIFIGDIASGDQFFSSEAQKNQVKQNLPDVLCVDMESAAAAQICYENKIPFGCIRIISDDARESAPMDFALFIKEVSSVYIKEIVKIFFKTKN